MRILITGGTGTISSGIVYEAVCRGNDVFAITRGNHDTRNINGANYLKLNVWDSNEVNKIIGENTYDIIVECLAYNVEQLTLSLNNFADKCEQYIFISTAGVYDRNNACSRISEGAEKNQIEWDYTYNKIKCEEYLKQFFCGRSNFYTIIRPVVTYGNYRIPFPIASRTPAWTLFDRMIKGIPIINCNNVKQSIIHIEDFSRAVLDLFGNEKAYNQDYHISENGQEVYWDDIINISGSILGISPRIIHIPIDVIKIAYPSIYEEIRWNKSSYFIVDDAKLKETIPEFKCQKCLEEGIKQTITESKNEFDSYNNTIDEEWWLQCDKTIFISVILKRISEEEMKIAKCYIKTWTGKKKIQILYRFIRDIIHYRIKCIIAKG